MLMKYILELQIAVCQSALYSQISEKQENITSAVCGVSFMYTLSAFGILINWLHSDVIYMWKYTVLHAWSNRGIINTSSYILKKAFIISF